MDPPAEIRRSPSNGNVAALVALWIAWAVLLASAMLVGELSSGGRRVDATLESPQGHASITATACRIGSSLVLAAAAWLAARWWPVVAPGRFALWIALGMTAGAIGDFFNVGLLGLLSGFHGVLGGIAAFALGHVAYIAGC